MAHCIGSHTIAVCGIYGRGYTPSRCSGLSKKDRDALFKKRTKGKKKGAIVGGGKHRPISSFGGHSSRKWAGAGSSRGNVYKKGGKGVKIPILAAERRQSRTNLLEKKTAGKKGIRGHRKRSQTGEGVGKALQGHVGGSKGKRARERRKRKLQGSPRRRGNLDRRG